LINIVFLQLIYLIIKINYLNNHIYYYFTIYITIIIRLISDYTDLKRTMFDLDYNLESTLLVIFEDGYSAGHVNGTALS